MPIIETEAQNIAAYIPTNLISITDGQIYLSPLLFQKGILPAVDVGKSVSRVGGKTQRPAYRAVTGDLRLTYAQFEELEAFSRSTIRSLRDAGFVEVVEREVPREAGESCLPSDTPPELMSGQAAAVEQIGSAVRSGAFEVALLHGVTGSGKTEVYLRSIARLSGTGRGSIVLMPASCSGDSSCGATARTGAEALRASRGAPISSAARRLRARRSRCCRCASGTAVGKRAALSTFKD